MGGEKTGDFTAGPGGVWTEEVGVVRGKLTLSTEPAGSLALTLCVQ